MVVRVLLVCAVLSFARQALAADPTLEAEVERLRSKVSELEASRDAAVEQMQELRAVVDDMQRQMQGAPEGPPPAPPTPRAEAPEEPAEPGAPEAEPGEIGEERADARRGFQAERAILERQGAVIVPAGQLVVEPGFQYTNSSKNFLNLSGVQFLDAILIGRVEVDAIDRNTYLPQIEARYGLHERVELQASVPYVFRSDRSLRDSGGDNPRIEDSYGNGIGDVQFGVFSQVLYQEKWWPSIVVNAQAFAPTGEDISEVDAGDLPLGLGVWGLSGGFTAVRSLDPAVLFGGVRYLATIGTDLEGFGDVDYGDTFEYTLGMAFSLNERLAFNLSMSQTITSETSVNGSGIKGTDLNAARLFLGGSYRLSNLITSNLALGIGLNDDAPDFSIELSFPLRFSKRFPHL